MTVINAYIGYKNAILTAALSASSAASGLPVTNLQAQQGARSAAWQTTGVTAEWLVADSGSASQTWQAFGLFRTNLTSAATVRWRVSNDPTFATSVYDSGVLAATVSPGYGQTVQAITAGPVTGRYLRVDLADPTSPDGFIYAALAYGGPVFCPLTNQDFSGGQGRTDGTVETLTRAGAEIPVTPWVRRTADVSLQGVRTSEVWASIQEIDRLCRTNINIVWIPTPAGAYIGQETVFGRLRPNGSVTWPYQGADRRAYKFQMTERL